MPVPSKAYKAEALQTLSGADLYGANGDSYTRLPAGYVARNGAVVPA